MRQAYDYWQDQPGSPQGENTTASRPQRPSLRTSPASLHTTSPPARATNPARDRPHALTGTGERPQGPTDSAFTPTPIAETTRTDRSQLPTRVPRRHQDDAAHRRATNATGAKRGTQRQTPSRKSRRHRPRRDDHAHPRNKPPLGKTQCSVHKPLSRPSQRRTTNGTRLITRPERAQRDRPN